MEFPTKQQLFAALSLPGFEGWRPEVDVPKLHRPLCRPDHLPGEGSIAAVLVLIYVDKTTDQTMLALTKRKSNLTKHASQISFPGGRQDAGETLEQTALRETHEEIGIPNQQVELLGQLNRVYIPPTDFEVTPFVGWHAGSPNFERSVQEVEQIIEVPLLHLLDPATLVFGNVISAGGNPLRVPFYEVGSHQVWGATAIMLGELIERLSRIRFGAEQRNCRDN